MLARVTTIQAHPERLYEGIRIYKDNTTVFRSQPGFTEALLLVNPANGRSLSITLWESEEMLNSSMGMSQHIAERMAAVLQSEPQRENYEVLRNRPGQDKVAARVSTIRVKPDWFDRADVQRDTSIIDAASRQLGYCGFLVLGNRSNHQVLGMSFWDSMAHLELSESGKGYYQQEMESSRDQWAGGWKRDIYDVAVELRPRE